MTTPGTLQSYLNLITSEYSTQPNFIATLTDLLTSFADCNYLLENLYTYFEVPTAVGDQLDKLGSWAGAYRNIQEPLVGVYFSLDSTSLGLDQGSMQGEFDPTTGLVTLSDSDFRQYLEMTIEINNSNGTKQSIYDALSPLFVPAQLVIQGSNNGDVFFGLLGTPNNAVFAKCLL